VDIVLGRGKEWKGIFTILSKFGNDVTLSIKKDENACKLILSCFEPGRAALVLVETIINSGDTVEFGISEMDIEKLAKTIRNQDTVKLVIEKETKCILEGRTYRELKIQTHDYFDEILEPKLDYDYTAVIHTKTLQDVVNKLYDFSDVTRIECVDNCIELTSVSENDIMKVAIPESRILNYNCQQKCRSTYSLHYISSFLTVPLSKYVQMGFSTDQPIFLQYQLPHWFFLRDDWTKVKFYLAPRIEAE